MAIPGSVTNIGDFAFYGCSSLTNLDIPASVTAIGQYVFAVCSSLTGAAISGGITNMADQFYGCANLQNVMIDSGVANIVAGEFDNFFSLAVVTIPGTVTSIGDYAFYGCTNLAGLTIPGSVTNIGDYAFYGCSSLTNAMIPASVAAIGQLAFAACSGLTGAAISGGITNMANQFYLCANLQTVTIDDGVTGIGAGEFNQFASLASVTIPDTVTNIGDYAFYACSNLTSVAIPASVAGIGQFVFAYCASLTGAAISGGITNMGYQFYGCANLQNVTIDSGVTGIAAGEFDEFASLASVTIPGTVANIGDYAFYGCSNLAAVTISNGVAGIGVEAFCGCVSLASLTIPGSVTNTGDEAFAFCGALSRVTILNGSTSIGAYEFYGCSNLARVNIPGTVTKIGQEAFTYCGALETVLFTGRPPAVGEGGFYGDTSALAYYYSGTPGWSSTFAGLKTAVVTAPSISTQPKSFSGLAGTNFSLTVAATGSPPLGYQWQLGGSNIPEATDHTLTVNDLQTTNAGSYQVVITNQFNESITSAVAVIAILYPPSITAQPGSLAALAGTNAALSVAAAGTAPLHYQWQLGRSNLPAATNATLAFNNIQWPNGGSYQVVITNKYGGATSVVATVAVLVRPSITTQPLNLTAVFGTNLTLGFGVTGTPPLRYQWQFAGSNLPGGTNALLVIPDFQAANQGAYHVAITNIYGGTSNLVATVKGLAAPFITAQPASQSIRQGGAATLQVAAAGAGPLTYQWRFNGAKLANGAHVSGVTNPSLTLANATTANAGSYEAIVVNSLGSAVSSPAIITVVVPPDITSQPAGADPAPGGIANFSVKASGTPLAFQWFFDGAPLSDGGNISGSAAGKLTVNVAASSNAGSYSVVVSNSAAAVTSTVVQLTLVAEKTAPSVAISSPVANSRAIAPILSGTASDTVRVLSVAYWVTNINNGVISTANGLAALSAGTGSFSNWTIQTALLPGSNILAVRSSNYSGLASPAVSDPFFYKVKAPLQLLVSPAGLGKVTGVASVTVAGDAAPSNNAALCIGEGYTLTAKPAFNCWLTNWLTNGVVAGSNTTFNFTMESNLTVTANFASNFFVRMAARYDGIFRSFPAGGGDGGQFGPDRKPGAQNQRRL